MKTSRPLPIAPAINQDHQGADDLRRPRTSCGVAGVWAIWGSGSGALGVSLAGGAAGVSEVSGLVVAAGVSPAGGVPGAGVVAGAGWGAGGVGRAPTRAASAATRLVTGS